MSSANQMTTAAKNTPTPVLLFPEDPEGAGVVIVAITVSAVVALLVLLPGLVMTGIIIKKRTKQKSSIPNTNLFNEFSDSCDRGMGKCLFLCYSV